MDPNTVVLEISSDEDVGWNDHDGSGIADDDHNWLSELLDEVSKEEKKSGDDSDEVVVVSEKKSKLKSRVIDLDDDCVVLDDDPDKPVEVRNSSNPSNVDDDDDSDDILVVSEKSQVACRDYPHPRHLCIKFPFSTTPNQSHCEQIYADSNLEIGSFREVQKEYSIMVEDEHLRARDALNLNQKYAYDEIMKHVDDDRSGVFFIDGPGGTGKTFLYKALLANIRSRGLIALATASSGVAANNMPGGRTAHSRFKIPLNLDNNSMCNIKKQSGTAQLLRDAKVIIWDETSMAKRQAVEALDRTMQDITGVKLPFGGKIMVMGGDFRQFLPIVRRGTRAQIVDSSLRMSPLWSSIKKIRLTLNMRAQTDPWFADFLLRVGDGVEEATEESFIRIPDDIAIAYTDKDRSKNDLIDAIFPSLEINGSDSDYIISRAILSTKNETVDEINDQLIDRLCGDEKVYYSFDEAEDDRNNFYPMEFLNTLTVSGLPPHYLRLKIGCPIILLRNIDPSNGLCNGTRLICRGFQQNVIDAEIAIGQHAGKRVFLPRISLCPSEDNMFPFKLKRIQFPVRLSFSMTINKAQGQTIPNVGVYLPESVFSHGQLYVALSRGTSRENTKVLVKPAKKFNRAGVYTSNVVYQEVLRD